MPLPVDTVEIVVTLPPSVVERLDELTRRLGTASRRMGAPVDVDASALLTARAGAAALCTGGRISVSGWSRLVPCADGWIAVTLSRDDDIALVPALVEHAAVHDEATAWETLTTWCAEHDCATIVERATLLGLAMARVGEPQDSSRDRDGLIVRTTDEGAGGFSSSSDLRVVDLSALWAGPLCGALLVAAGAEVTKVVSRRAVTGPAVPLAALDEGKTRVVVDLTTVSGRTGLRRLLADADVVIEASRPRALSQLGIDVPLPGPRVWLSIAAHGYRGEAGHRIGYGDDTAAAGGLVGWTPDGPVFVGDAIADPLTGLSAATVAMELLAVGGRHHVDVAMSAVSARAASPRGASAST